MKGNKKKGNYQIEAWKNKEGDDLRILEEDWRCCMAMEGTNGGKVDDWKREMWETVN